MAKAITSLLARRIGARLGVDFKRVDLEQFRRGLEVEQEHKDVTGGDMETTGKIAHAHLKELPDYYTRLSKMEKSLIVIVWKAVPALSPEEVGKVRGAMSDKEHPLFGAELAPHAKIGVRLNLNVLKRTGVPLQSVHAKTHSGKVVGYHHAVTLKNVSFNVNQHGREAIASGKEHKHPMASVDGELHTEGEHSDKGVPVRFNPKTDHLFTHAETGEAIRGADEVTVVGHRAYARGNIRYWKEGDAPKPVAPSNTKYSAEEYRHHSADATPAKQKPTPGKGGQLDLFGLDKACVLIKAIDKRDKHTSAMDFDAAPEPAPLPEPSGPTRHIAEQGTFSLGLARQTIAENDPRHHHFELHDGGKAIARRVGGKMHLTAMTPKGNWRHYVEQDNGKAVKTDEGTIRMARKTGTSLSALDYRTRHNHYYVAGHDNRYHEAVEPTREAAMIRAAHTWGVESSHKSVSKAVVIVWKSHDPVCPECGTVMEWDTSEKKCNRCGCTKEPIEKAVDKRDRQTASMHLPQHSNREYEEQTENWMRKWHKDDVTPPPHGNAEYEDIAERMSSGEDVHPDELKKYPVLASEYGKHPKGLNHGAMVKIKNGEHEGHFGQIQSAKLHPDEKASHAKAKMMLTVKHHAPLSSGLLTGSSSHEFHEKDVQVLPDKAAPRGYCESCGNPLRRTNQPYCQKCQAKELDPAWEKHQAFLNRPSGDTIRYDVKKSIFVIAMNKAVDKRDKATVGMDFDAPESEPENPHAELHKLPYKEVEKRYYEASEATDHARHALHATLNRNDLANKEHLPLIESHQKAVKAADAESERLGQAMYTHPNNPYNAPKGQKAEYNPDRPFDHLRTAEDHTFKSPFTGEDIKVSYRGPHEGKAVVFDKKAGVQYSVDPQHLTPV